MKMQSNRVKHACVWATRLLVLTLVAASASSASAEYYPLKVSASASGANPKTVCAGEETTADLSATADQPTGNEESPKPTSGPNWSWSNPPIIERRMSKEEQWELIPNAGAGVWIEHLDGSVPAATLHATVGAGYYRIAMTATVSYNDDQGNTWEGTSEIVEVLFTSISVVLKQATFRISAKSACGVNKPEYQNAITVTVVPDGEKSAVQLVVGQVLPAESPEGTGSVSKGANEEWLYEAYNEPKTDHHPVARNVTINAEVNGTKCGDGVEFKVVPVFNYLTNPPVITKQAGTPNAGGEYERAYNFIRCKYPCLNNAGSFNGVGISSNHTTDCSGKDAMGCTNIVTGKVVFGIAAFADENLCASTIGHELTHTPAGGSSSECKAYSWEVNNTACTGLQGSNLDLAKSKQIEECK